MVSIGGSNSDLCFASGNVVLYAISCFIGWCYNITQLLAETGHSAIPDQSLPRQPPCCQQSESSHRNVLSIEVPHLTHFFLNLYENIVYLSYCFQSSTYVYNMHEVDKTCMSIHSSDEPIYSIITIQKQFSDVCGFSSKSLLVFFVEMWDGATGFCKESMCSSCSFYLCYWRHRGYHVVFHETARLSSPCHHLFCGNL